MNDYQEELNNIKHILKTHPEGMTVQQIAQLSNNNRNSVAKYLDVIRATGNAEMKKIGPAKLFFYTQRVPLQAVTNHTKSIFLFIDEQLNITDVNKSFEELIGLKRKHIIGKKIGSENQKQLFNETTLKQFKTFCQEALKGTEIKKEISLKLKGKHQWFLIKGIPTTLNDNLKGITIIGEDITTQKETKEALEKSNKELAEEKSLFLKGPVALFKWQQQKGWPVTYASPNIKEILGYDAEEFLTHKIQYPQIIHKEDLKRVSEEARTNEEQGKDYFEHQPYRLRTKQGTYTWVNVHTRIIRDKEGNITHNLCYLINIDKIKSPTEKN